MTELKPIERTIRIIQKINEENTGSRTEFAEYIGLAPQNLTCYINKISAELKIGIAYSRKRCTYYFTKKQGNILPPPLFRMIINLHQSVGKCVAFLNTLIFVSKPN